MSTRLALLALLLGASPLAFADDAVGYRIRASIAPSTHLLVAEVELPVPSSGRFRLHPGLDPQVDDGRVELVTVDESGRVPVAEYRVRFDGPRPERMTVRYRGEIHHAIETSGQEYARSFSGSPGLITAEGAVLSQSCAWLPSIGDSLVTFDLTVDLPESWTAVSQGALASDQVQGGRRTVRWSCPHPMDDVYLIAAPFHVTRRAAGAVEAMTFLRAPDTALADRYLEATAQYLDLYQRLLGPYPYAKFALVENFWETGYGMPSFTLLGPRVIRFPFILHSSYPHEILHNWWGNSVFVDWETGNWCEGLTAYLADHLIKEGRGQGTAYRRDGLAKYRSYVRGAQDFPLREFRSRHSASTEAVGYGKSLMLFHMLRRNLGDELFTRGLQRFYRRHQFTRASFDDLARVFSETGERDLAPFFAQWVDRTGAPSLALEVEPVDGGRGRVTVTQTQSDEPYLLQVPVAIHRSGKERADWQIVPMTGRTATIELSDFPSVTRVSVDPEFDLFRRLDPAETPPTLARLFGAERVVLVLPSERGSSGSASAPDDAWRALAESWATGPDVRVVRDSELDALPADEAVWILGSDRNAWSARLGDPLEARTRSVGPKGIGEVTESGASENCGAIVLDHPHREDLAVGLMHATHAAALPGLARKLPHYGRYSYVAFTGDEPTNTIKGQWPITGSPLEWARPDAPPALPLPERAPLATPKPVFDERALIAHVNFLASDELEGRGVSTPGLDHAADYIAEQFRAAGLETLGDDGSYFEHFVLTRGPDGKPVILKNVVGVIRGSEADWADQSVVIGAHYDHLGRGWPDVRAGHEGKVHNGADDNASGVSVLIETAKKLAKSEPRRSLVFVAFSGEEAGRHGSKHFAGRDHGSFHRDRVLGMINLDGVGRLEGRPLQILGAGTAYEWPHIARGIGFTTGVESRSIPGDPGGSDQVSFHEIGIPAIHLFGGLHADYHRSTDDADKIDGAGLVKVCVWLEEALEYLAAREEPLKSQLADETDASPAPSSSTTTRRVLLGTEPEFAFAGPGVKVAGITAGSPAEAAGLRAGDILLSLDGKELTDLRAYAGVLRAHQPGDVVTLKVRRDGETIDVQVTLKGR